jgi:hypothetical protein
VGLVSFNDDAAFETTDTSCVTFRGAQQQMAPLSFDGSQNGSPVGYFTYTVAEDRWTWSDGIYALHGFVPQEVPATTGVLLSHKHPDDRSRAFEVLENACKDGEPFSCYHRIIDRSQRVRSVLSVGRGVVGPGGTVQEVVGFFIDLTEVRRSETNADVEIALARIAETRTVIDQAKGMLMLAAGCDDESAFALLRRYSQNANVKVRDLARLLVGAAAAGLFVNVDTRSGVLSFLDDLKVQPSAELRAT